MVTSNTLILEPLGIPINCKLMYERHFGVQTFKYGAQIVDILAVLHLTFGIFHGD